MVAQFRRIERVTGRTLLLRNATVSDADFIFKLRADPPNAQYLSETSPELSEQVRWLEHYSTDDSQLYFIITDMLKNPVGTIRIYDQRKTSFCLGSWIIVAGSPSHYALESVLMVYQIGLRLGFDQAHLDVRKDNVSVWRFHERFGALRVSETARDYFYNISRESINRALEKYKKYLPDQVIINFGPD